MAKPTKQQKQQYGNNLGKPVTPTGANPIVNNGVIDSSPRDVYDKATGTFVSRNQATQLIAERAANPNKLASAERQAKANELKDAEQKQKNVLTEQALANTAQTNVLTAEAQRQGLIQPETQQQAQPIEQPQAQQPVEQQIPTQSAFSKFFFGQKYVTNPQGEKVPLVAGYAPFVPAASSVAAAGAAISGAGEAQGLVASSGAIDAAHTLSFAGAVGSSKLLSSALLTYVGGKVYSELKGNLKDADAALTRTMDGANLAINNVKAGLAEPEEAQAALDLTEVSLDDLERATKIYSYLPFSNVRRSQAAIANAKRQIPILRLRLAEAQRQSLINQARVNFGQ